jgi:hypothetical protein
MIEGIPGLHRLEAAKERGWETIDAFFEGDKIDDRTWQLSRRSPRSSRVRPSSRPTHPCKEERGKGGPWPRKKRHLKSTPIT